jgi:hypothetical protein
MCVCECVCVNVCMCVCVFAPFSRGKRSAGMSKLLSSRKKRGVSSCRGEVLDGGSVNVLAYIHESQSFILGTQIYTCIYMHTSEHTQMHRCMKTHIHVSTFTYTHRSTHKHVGSGMCNHKQTHTHTHTHTRANTNTRGAAWR